MTDRVHSLTVILEKDTRDDDVECWVSAIRMLKGVISVQKNISDIDYHVAEQRAKQEIRSKLFDIIKS